MADMDEQQIKNQAEGGRTEAGAEAAPQTWARAGRAKRLTVKAIEALRPKARPYEVSDGGGLFLTVRPNGSKSFTVRYRFAGRSRNYTLGSVIIGLPEARKLAAEALVEVARGNDPAATKATRKAAAKVAAQANDTVSAVVDRFVDEYLKRECKASWAKEAERLLRVEIVSVWGKRKMPEITDDDVVRRMDEIARRSGTTANRTFAVWRKLCNWAANAKRKIIKASPCAGLEKPASETKRDRILSDAELRLIWQATECLDYPFGPLFKVLLLTGQRRGETAAMCWNEIDDGGIWMIPATKTKNGLTHLVPLPPAVIELLKTLPRLSRDKGEADYVFSPGVRPPSGFSRAKERLDAAILAKLRETDLQAEPIKGWRIHDLRHAVSTGMAALRILPHVREAVLNHVSGFKAGVAGTYDHHEYLDEKRDALEAWAEHVEVLATGTTAKPNFSVLRTSLQRLETHIEQLRDDVPRDVRDALQWLSGQIETAATKAEEPATKAVPFQRSGRKRGAA
jgi:integrase